MAHDVDLSPHSWNYLWLLSKVVVTRFIHWRVIISPFYNYRYLGNEVLLWDHVNIPLLLQLLPPSLASIDISAWIYYCYGGMFVVTKRWLSDSIISSSFISWNFTIRKSFLIISEWTHGFLFYSVGYDLSFSLFALIFKLSWISCFVWFLCHVSIIHYFLVQ